MKIILNINKRYAYAIIGLLILGIGVFVVNALTPGVAPNPGHTIDTVAPPAGCVDGQVLKFIDESSGWGCIDLSVDTDTRCDVSGTCSQVCIGNDCQSDWPSGGTLSCYYIQSGTYTVNGNSGMCNSGYQYIGPNSAGAHGGFCCKIN